MLSEDEILAKRQGEYINLAAAAHDAGHNIAGEHITGGAAAKVNDVVLVSGVPVTITKSRVVAVRMAEGDSRAELVDCICQAMRALIKEVNADIVGGQVALATRVPIWPDDLKSQVKLSRQVDPHTGVVFGIARQEGFRQTRYEVSLAWGVAPLDQPQRAAA